jgi:MFS family permease
MSEKIKQERKEPLFKRNFTLVIIGQIITLYGNAMLRFALPLYVLEQSGSAALFGIVSATAFLPMIIMSPVGGILADRVNKQRMMVTLDFLTAALVLGFILLQGKIALIPSLVITLTILYGLNGAESPVVQASMPLLVKTDQLVSANAVVNIVQSFSGLTGPIIGGVLYGAFGLSPILFISFGCFAVAATLETFIRIPYTPRNERKSVWAIVRDDMKQSMRFILKEKPIIAKVIGLMFCFTLFMGPLIIIGMPVLINQNLEMGKELFGISQGVMAGGGLLGGLLAGVLNKKLDIRKCYLLLLSAAIGAAPMGGIFLLTVSPLVKYLVITLMGFTFMIISTSRSTRITSTCLTLTRKTLLILRRSSARS